MFCNEHTASDIGNLDAGAKYEGKVKWIWKLMSA